MLLAVKSNFPRFAEKVIPIVRGMISINAKAPNVAVIETSAPGVRFTIPLLFACHFPNTSTGKKNTHRSRPNNGDERMFRRHSYQSCAAWGDRNACRWRDCVQTMVRQSGIPRNCCSSPRRDIDKAFAANGYAI